MHIFVAGYTDVFLFILRNTSYRLQLLVISERFDEGDDKNDKMKVDYYSETGEGKYSTLTYQLQLRGNVTKQTQRLDKETQ